MILDSYLARADQFADTAAESYTRQAVEESRLAEQRAVGADAALQAAHQHRMAVDADPAAGMRDMQQIDSSMAARFECEIQAARADQINTAEI